MINLELIRKEIRNPSFYGFLFAFVGAFGIFSYSIYNNTQVWNEKEDGNQTITIQLSAFAPPSKDPIADKIEKPKYHKSRKHKPKRHEIEAPPKLEPSPLQAAEKPQPEVAEEKIQPEKEIKDTQEAKTATTIKSSPDALAQENIKMMRYSDGVENEFLQAIYRAMLKRHVYPPLAIQRGYEGEVLVKFMIDVTGEISQLEIVKHSPYSLLDKAAIKTVKRACKDFPKPRENVYIEIPIAYNLQQG